MVRCGRQANIVLHTVLHTVLYRVTHHVLSARIGWLVCERFSLRDTDSRPCVAIAVRARAFVWPQTVCWMRFPSAWMLWSDCNLHFMYHALQYNNSRKSGKKKMKHVS